MQHRKLKCKCHSAIGGISLQIPASELAVYSAVVRKMLYKDPFSRDTLTYKSCKSVKKPLFLPSLTGHDSSLKQTCNASSNIGTKGRTTSCDTCNKIKPGGNWTYHSHFPTIIKNNITTNFSI